MMTMIWVSSADIINCMLNRGGWRSACEAAKIATFNNSGLVKFGGCGTI